MQKTLPDADALDEEVVSIFAEDCEDLKRTQTALLAEAEAQGMSFEGRAYPVSVRPMLVPRSRAADIKALSEAFVASLDTAVALYAEDPRIRALFPAYESVRELALELPDLRPMASLCRLDGVIDPYGCFKILETNTACPGGVIQAGMAARLWHRMRGSVGSGIAVDESAQPLVQHPGHFACYLDATHSRLRGERASRAAVVNYQGRYTNETAWIVSELCHRDIETELLDARDLRWDPRSGLRSGTAKLDLVYNKLDPLELIDNPEVRDYLQAAAHHGVTFLSPLVAQWLLEDKAILAVLSDQRFHDAFSPGQRELFEQHVPWTRFCQNGPATDQNGERADLWDMVTAQRRSLVLKPTNASRGDGVVIGRTVSPAVWNAAVARAFASGRYVVQEIVEPRTVLVPDPDGAEPIRMFCGVDAFVFNGSFAGFHSRASRDPVMNIGRRGVLLPVIVPAI